jgi:hypothetical protein
VFKKRLHEFSLRRQQGAEPHQRLSLITTGPQHNGDDSITVVRRLNWSRENATRRNNLLQAQHVWVMLGEYAAAPRAYTGQNMANLIAVFGTMSDHAKSTPKAFRWLKFTVSEKR